MPGFVDYGLQEMIHAKGWNLGERGGTTVVNYEKRMTGHNRPPMVLEISLIVLLRGRGT
jgi:hypothetical protein